MVAAEICDAGKVAAEDEVVVRFGRRHSEDLGVVDERKKSPGFERGEEYGLNLLAPRVVRKRAEFSEPLKLKKLQG